MASCVINKNRPLSERVVTRNGDKSILFGKIMNIPFIGEWDEGVRYYANVLTGEFKKKFGDWEKRIASNPRAVNKIKADLLGNANLDNIVRAASNMENPVLVRRVGGDNIGSRMTYSTDLNGEGEVFLYDHTTFDTVDLEEAVIPDDTTSEAFTAEAINGNPNPVIDLTLPSGEKVMAISPDQTIYNINDVSDDTVISPFIYDNGEPRLYFLNNAGDAFEDYASALKSSGEGNISVGFIAGTSSDITMLPDGRIHLVRQDAFVEIASVSTESNLSTPEGMINNLIRKGYISGEKEEVNGIYYLVGEGEEDGAKTYNANAAIGLIRLLPDFKYSSVDEYGRIRITYNKKNSRVLMRGIDGLTSNFSKEYIKRSLAEGKYAELKKNYPDLDMLIACMFQEDNELFKSNTSNLIEDERANDARIRSSMVQILQTLGVSIIGMDEYLEKYKDKNGVEPSAKALADLGEKVIALAEGAGMEDLTEEVSHFLVETYHDQNAIEELLPEVENTDEWREYAKQYYNIYGKKYKGEELTRMVRKEILGKILRNQFLVRFNDANIESESRPFFQRLVDLFAGMIRRIQGFFTTDKAESFRGFVDQMATDALSDNPNAFDIRNLDNADFTLYSAADEQAMQVFQNAKTILQIQLKNARRAKSGMSQQLKGNLDRVEKSINNLAVQMNDLNVASTITNLVATTEAQANYLDKLVTTYNNAIRSGRNKDKAMFDLTDQSNLDNINSLMMPMVSQLRGFINTNEDLDLNPEFKRQILSRIDRVNAKVDALNADVKALRKIDNNTIVNRLLDYFNVDEDGRGFIMTFLSNVMKDVSWITRWYGTLEHSSNPLLGMLMNFISYNNYNANIKTQDDMSDLVRVAQGQNWDVERFEKILKKDGGEYSSYLKSEIDYVKFRHEFEKAQAQALKDAMPELSASVDEIVKNGISIEGVIIKPNIHGVNLGKLSEEQLQKYEDSFNAWLSKNTERRYQDKYYEEINKIYEDAAKREDGTYRPISRAAIDFNRNISARRYQIKRRFMSPDGKTDMDALYHDIDAYTEWKDIRRSEREASSYIDPMTGLEKTGKELELAEDLRAINKAWAAWMKKNGTTEYSMDTINGFLGRLKEVQDKEGSAAAFDFLVANSNFSFSDKFWKGLPEKSSSMIDSILDPSSDDYRLDFDGEPITIADMEELEELNKEVKDLRRQQHEIMRIYYEADLPGEINYDSMPEEAKAKIKEIQDELQARNSRIRNILNDANYQTSGIETEYETNEAFGRALSDSLDTTFDFCRKHASSQNQKRMDYFRAKIEDLKNGKEFNLSPYERRFIMKNLGIDNDPNINIKKQMAYYAAEDPEVLDKLVEDYAKALVLPYFKRFAPEGYKDWLIRSRMMDVHAVAARILNGNPQKGIEEYLSIGISRDYQLEESVFDKYINKNYNEYSPYGYYQPKKDTYRDDEYYSHFGINQNGEATINLEEHNMINNLVGLKRKALGASGYNEGERHGYNLYEIPQISKSSMEKLYQLKNDPKASIGNAVRDLVSIRVDDPIYGQTSDLNVDGVDTQQFNVIPKYYLRELEERSDVSHDLVRSYTLFMLQANLYNEKMGTIGDVMGLQQALLNAKFEKGVTPVATNTYNMFKEWMNAHYYGIHMNAKKMEVEVLGAKIDVSKVIMAFDKFVRYQNLAFSVPVALTGFTTGQLNTAVEGAVGQYVNSSSLRFADGEILKMTSGYVSEVGGIDRRNKLYVLGERMGIYSIKSRTATAGYNKAMRILGDSLGYKMMDVLNYPLAPKIMISIMHDTRLAEDGKFYRYNSFARRITNEERAAGRTISRKEIKKRWEKLKDKSLYNIVDVRDGQVVIKDGYTDEQKALIERQMRITQREIRSLDNICDGVLSSEDKSSASRNWMMSFTMAHRGWFQIAMQRRYKSLGYNFSTNQLEEGTHRTLARYMMKSLSLLKDGRMKELFDVINRSWASMPDHERVNLYRSIIDVSVFMMGSLVWMAAMSFDDDDERSNWVVQMASYVMMRTVNEMYSQLPILLEVNAIDTIYNPFPVMQKMRDIVMPKNWSFDEVQSGAYEGHSKLFRLFAKQTFIKQWYTMKDGEDVYRTKKGWLLNNPIMLFDSPKKNEAEPFED